MKIKTETNWNWRKTAVLFQAVSAVATLSASAGMVRITAINDQYNPNHSRVVEVRPGDIVNLSADILDEYNNYNPTYVPVEKFTWYANDRTGDACDASSTLDCLTSSNFQVTNYGVSFYVPYNMGAEVLVSVYSNDPNARDYQGRITFDTIVLRNALYQDGYTPPTRVITNAGDYNQGTLNADYALAGQGRWVWISGTRYWVPYSYMLHDNDWTPYRHGYWSYDSVYGYTWISYDPWGWMTDHYGVWRYHGVYGWTWLPFSDYRYRPHCATFFYHDGYIGWYPYYNSYSHGYVHGYNDGFRDGFWAGYNAAQGYGNSGYGYRPGYTVVSYTHFGHRNIINVHNQTIINNTNVTVIQNGWRNNSFGTMPGRATNALEARNFVTSRGGNAVETRTEAMGSRGQVMAPRAVNQVPSEYGSVVRSSSLNRNTPVGSVVDARAGGEGRVVAPTSNGRGVATAPRVVDRSGTSRDMPVQTSRPAEMNRENPGSATRTMPTQTAGSDRRIPNAPVYNPGAPSSRDPIRPTTRPEPTRPTEQPTQPQREPQREPQRQPSQPREPSQPTQPQREPQREPQRQPSQPTQPQREPQREPQRQPSQPTQPQREPQREPQRQPSQPTQPQREPQRQPSPPQRSEPQRQPSAPQRSEPQRQPSPPQRSEPQRQPSAPQRSEPQRQPSAPSNGGGGGASRPAPSGPSPSAPSRPGGRR